MNTTTWYHVSSLRYTPRIEKVEVVKATDKTVWIKEKQWSLSPDNSKYEVRRHPRDEFFSTFAEARQVVMDHLKKQSDALRLQMNRNDELWKHFFLMEESAVKPE